MEKLLITGANGQLGVAVNQLLAGQYELVNTDVAELDITDVAAVQKLVQEVKPYAVINCAAHTAVDRCESEEAAAFRINAVGPRNLAIATAEAGAKLVHISTDYVFDGTAGKAYTEFDAPSPASVYGASKLAGEYFVKDFARHYFILRTAWLYGEGKNFVKTMLRLAEEKDSVAVVDDQIGSPTSAEELARAIAWLLPTDNYGLYHATCDGECSWADFATEIFRLAGKQTKVQRISTAEYPTPARRPAYSVLRNYMLELCGGYRFADWQQALKEYYCTQLRCEQ
ncbi:MAG: dTDP-4-dehydrorhamnose reductase [Lachnospiraceae bacterium]|jgi:dTDP-4-dehydrorhamnose reductase|nr:dTDP-4-dehydrorhamnose reductase [Lachnospiraceae bacterium]